MNVILATLHFNQKIGLKKLMKNISKKALKLRNKKSGCSGSLVAKLGPSKVKKLNILPPVRAFVKTNESIILGATVEVSDYLNRFSQELRSNYLKDVDLVKDLEKIVSRDFGKVMGGPVQVGPLGCLLKISIEEASYEQLEKLLLISKELYEILSGVGFRNGFVNDSNLTGGTYSLVRKYIPVLLDYDYGKARPELVEARRKNPIAFYKQTIGASCSEDRVIKFYNNVVNCILMQIYSINQKISKELEKRDSIVYLVLKSEVKMFGVLLKGYVDLDIREKLQKRAIKIKKVIYSGFDTEFQNKEFNVNKYLSLQSTSVGRLMLIIPKQTEYIPLGINSLTGEKYSVSSDVPGLSVANYKRIIQDNINIIRSTNYEKEYSECERMTNVMRELGWDYVTLEDKIVYLSPINQIENNMRDIRKTKISLDSFVKSLACKINNDLNKEVELLVGGLKVLSGKSEKLEAPNRLADIEKMKDKNIMDVSDLDTSEFEIEKQKSYKINGLKIQVEKEMNLFAHYNSADLTCFKDFEEFKDKLSIVKKSFITTRPMKYNGWKVNLRDTILLCSAVASSLAVVGAGHGIEKKELSRFEIENMEKLMESDYEKFKSYALRDSYITLLHGLFCVQNSQEMGDFKLPTTISSITKKNCINNWNRKGYKGYQINPEKLMCDEAVSSPKSVSGLGKIGIDLNLLNSCYRGGMNISCMVGKSVGEKYIDYDLAGCYPTGMSQLGQPNYLELKEINQSELESLEDVDIFNRYLVLHVNFKFPDYVKYPHIACNVDKTVDTYPLNGVSVITGYDYLLAKKLNAQINLIRGVVIPFKPLLDEIGAVKEKNALGMRPFFDIIMDLQAKRKSYRKGSAKERWYKDMANTLYGLTCQGLSRKKSYDILTNSMKVVRGSFLTNPFIASYITSFARCTLAECMNNVHTMGHKVVSATTDGFITNMDDMEEKLMNNFVCNLENMESKIVKNTALDSTFLLAYRNARTELGHEASAWEIKTKVDKIYTWTTRGQLGMQENEVGIDGYMGHIVAMTGFQRKSVKSLKDLESIISTSYSRNKKEIYFMKSSLRGANEIYKKGGDSTMKYSEQKFRLIYDNKRMVVLPKDLHKKYPENVKKDSKGWYLDLTAGKGLLLDTNPYRDVDQCRLNRYIGNRLRNRIYKHREYLPRLLPQFSCYKDMEVRSIFRKYIVDSRNVGPITFLSKFFELLKVGYGRAKLQKYLDYIAGLKIYGDYIPNAVPKKVLDCELI